MKKYVDLAKKRQNVSQNGLAKMLGITGGGLSHIVNGGTASDETIVKLARLAGVKPEIILADRKLDEPLMPEVKAMWERIRGQAAVWLIVSVSALPLVREVGIYILCKITSKPPIVTEISK